jgi:hypothetical protein
MMPGAQIQQWDGLPLDSLPELLALAVLVPVALSRRLRAELVQLGARLHPRPVWAITLILAAVLVLKAILLVGGPEDGFRACYSSPAAAAPPGGCERSYSNAFARYGGVTRIDHEIAFGAPTPEPGGGLSLTNWNLSFFNDQRFNLPSKPSNPIPRERLPIAARWTGTLDTTGADLRISYLGEGELRLGATRTVLPQSYLGSREIRVRTTPGHHSFALSYLYKPLISVAPQGSVRVALAPAPSIAGAGQSLHVVPPAPEWRVAAFLDDAAFAALLLLIAVGQALLLSARDRMFVLAVIGGSWVVLVGHTPWTEALIIGALGAGLLLYRPDRPLVVSWYTVIVVGSLYALVSAPDLHQVVYRTSGNDFLTYESQARAILGGSLQGGESVFHYQPGWRYVLFLQRLFFGDGEVLRSVFTFATLTLPMIAVGFWAVSRRPDLWARAITAGLVGVLIAVVNSPDVRTLVGASLSESATWALIPLLVAIPFFAPKQRWPWLAGPAAAALTVAIRPNHLVAALLIVAAIALAARPAQRRWVAYGAGIALLIVFLPTLHDTVYSGSFHLAVTTGTRTGTLAISPSDLTRVFSNGSVRSELWQHVESILYIRGSTYSWTLALLMPALLVSWLLIALFTVRRRRALPRAHQVMMLVPAAYLAPHLLYEVDVYFPRHVIAGYLAMAAVTVCALGTADHLQRAAAPDWVRRRMRMLPSVTDRWERWRTGPLARS